MNQTSSSSIHSTCPSQHTWHFAWLQPQKAAVKSKRQLVAKQTSVTGTRQSRQLGSCRCHSHMKLTSGWTPSRMFLMFFALLFSLIISRWRFTEIFFLPSCQFSLAFWPSNMQHAEGIWLACSSAFVWPLRTRMKRRKTRRACWGVVRSTPAVFTSRLTQKSRKR